MSKKATTKKLTKRLQAAYSVEISLSMTMVLIGAILILALFGRSLATAFLETTFPEHFVQKQDTAQALVINNKNTAFTPTQIDVALTASQGIKFTTETEAKNWSLSSISDVLEMDAPNQHDLESLAKAATIADRLKLYKFPTGTKTLSKAEFKKIINTDKYGNIDIKAKTSKSELTTTVNGKKMTVIISSSNQDVIALLNAIYNAKFE